MFTLDKSDSSRPLDAALLTIEEQHEIGVKLESLARKDSIYWRLLFPNSGYTNVLALAPLSFYTWRAGFRGYGLCKYGRGRILTVVMALIYPTYGGFSNETWGTTALMQPFRKEDPWYHGARFALANQPGVFITVTGNIFLSFLIASRSGLLPIPDGMHKPGIREVAAQILVGRVKPYTKSIVLSAVLSTAFMFAVGYAAYLRTNTLLADMNRKSLIYKED
jgi:hypothetical protein